MQPGTALNTTASRMLKFALLAFLDSSLEATGDVYFDDGKSLDMKKSVKLILNSVISL